MFLCTNIIVVSYEIWARNIYYDSNSDKFATTAEFRSPVSMTITLILHLSFPRRCGWNSGKYGSTKINFSFLV